MAPAKIVSLLLILSCFCSPLMVKANPLRICGFDKIFQLGDSISDTGNLIREVPIGASTPFARLPYGKDFYRTPTGRCSNGLLMIDFIARASGLPLLHAYKDPNGEFSHGVNFAVAGSTALSSDTLAAMRVLSPVTRSSLDVQLDWLSTHLNSTCSNHEECVERALFMVGEIGGNDYNYAIFQGKSMDEMRQMVPQVVKAILDGVRRTIDLGAKRVVVPGNFPTGCLPIYKTAFQTNNSSDYDNNLCLKQLNEFAVYHNRELQNGINRMIQEEKPNALIVYADYYNAYEFLLHFAKHHGLDSQRACCGTGGKYNFNMTSMCGAHGVPVCRNANWFVSWDGIHLTQEGYGIMSGWLVRELLAKLNCLRRLP
ncbi:GDSL-like Lipase/Acylhydrolase family protein [Striga asiatica]|uniref:GDSL-like Lipase/Acylhydrolase family protein n=1 Tax=Striga asiatica TaxID=4170 RepID=A0A5A7PGB1_STRAF|nr:GDSL-like Lipase/Acylhydrolase family protein [Striga asiatica]